MDQPIEELYGGAGGHRGDTTDQVWSWSWKIYWGDCLVFTDISVALRGHINTASYKSFITKKQNIQGKSGIFMRNMIINIGVFICKKS